MDIARLTQVVDNNARVTDMFINEFKGELCKHALDISDVNKVLGKILKGQARLNWKIRLYTLAFGTLAMSAMGYLYKHDEEIRKLRCEIEELKHKKGI